MTTVTCSDHSVAQFIPIGSLIDPHGAQGRDNLALYGQPRMSGIVRDLERTLISALEVIVFGRSQRDVEGFARNILQTPTAGVIEFRPAQRFTVTAAMTNTQAAILPEFSFRAEALRRMNEHPTRAARAGTPL